MFASRRIGAQVALLVVVLTMTFVATKVEASPISISLTTTPAVQDLGAGFFKLHDSANVTGGFSPTGTLVFSLFNPSDTLVYTNVVVINGEGVYDTSTGNN